MSVFGYGPIPDGWEIVEWGQLTCPGMKFWSDILGSWTPSNRYGLVVGSNFQTYIRPIRREAEPKTTFETEVKGEPVATARQWIAIPEGIDLKTGQKVLVTVEVE